LASNRRLLRAAAAFLAFMLSEYTAWLGVLVYAYAQGGATTAGLVAVAQLVPAALLAPVLATIADRAPTRVLALGFVVQTLALAVTAGSMLAGMSPYAAYAGAVVASAALATTRPAFSTITPALARTADELTACNVVLGWTEQVALALSGLLTGVLLAVGSAGLVLLAGASLAALAVIPLWGVRVVSHGLDGDDSSTWAQLREGLLALRASPQAGLLVALLTSLWVLLGALDVLLVVLAEDVLDRGPEWAGYLNTAFGAGGIAAGALTAGLVGRRLGGPILLAAGAASVGLGLTALAGSAAMTAVLLATAGAGAAVLEVATRTLLQRSVPAELVGRMFGIVEGLTTAGLAVGAISVPVLIHLGGPAVALLGVALVLPVAALMGGRALLGLDAAATVPVVEIALLRSLPHFAALPPPALEGIAGALEPVALRPGETLFRQGDVGDRFYAIADGQVDISIDGRPVRTEARGEGFGEIALLRDVPRTATVTARTASRLYALDREMFLTVLTGNESSRRSTEAVVGAYER
jgi:hypothetical protein